MQREARTAVRPIVIDSGVLVSAALNPESVPARAFRLALELFSPVVSIETMAELTDVLQRAELDRFVRRELRDRFLVSFQANATLVNVTEKVQALVLVSGDDDLKVLHPFRGIAILTPREFLERFAGDYANN